MNNLTVAICDDSKQMCEYIEFICGRADDIEFVGYACSSKECLALVEEKAPDVLLLDIQIEQDNSGVLLIPQILDIEPQTKILILTVHKEDEYIFSALAEGASNYILKTQSAEEILSAVRNVNKDNLQLNADITKAILNQGKKIQRSQQSLLYTANIIWQLTASEYEVLKSVYDGKSYKEIAKERYVEEGTIRVLVSRLLKKFNVERMSVLVKELRNLQIFDFCGFHDFNKKTDRNEE